MKNIVIGGAWPYANGPLHIGHIAALLPGDVLARYYRAKGDRVFYVSGSDCHGTPITLRARQEGRTPLEISERYHREFCQVFDALGFSYDLCTQTTHPQHISFVQDFHRRMYAGPYVEERTVLEARCPICRKALADRLIVGTCPACGAQTRGDQCDACGEVLDADSIADARCAECGSPVAFEQTKQLFLCVSRLRDALARQLTDHPYWRKNAAAFTKRYIDEGLRDRAITRDLDWGIDVPKDGYENKKIYIWAENVLGYLSACARLCKERGVAFEEVYGENARHYYVHGKDNIPFHTIILPALLLGEGSGLRLPDDIISSEYLMLEGRKISTSQNWAIWAHDLTQTYDPDAIRYFFLANGPERRDADFSLREFVEQNNSELVGAWGNLVNRTLAFVQKYLGGHIPQGVPEAEIVQRVEAAYAEIGQKIENGCLRDALQAAFDLVRFGNRYYDAQEPWKTRASAPQACAAALADCVYLIANLGVLLYPFLPFSSAKVLRWLSVTARWTPQTPCAQTIPDDLSILFARIKQPEPDLPSAKP